MSANHPRKRQPTIAAVLAVLLLATPLVTVRGAPQDQGDSVLRIQQEYYPASFDPQRGAGLEFATVLSTNYEGLTRLDKDLSVVPAAAESWEFSSAGQTLTFSLHDGLTYSDGSPLTAGRFADAIRRGCDPTVGGDYQHILFDVVGCQEFAGLDIGTEDASALAPDDAAAYSAARDAVGVQALDDRTLEIRLNHPAPYFPAIAGMPIVYPAKQELIEQGGDDWWAEPALQLGNGPFQITRMEPDQLIVFEANDAYWGGRPKLDRLEYVFEPDSGKALDAYAAGDLDIVSVYSDQLPAIEADAVLRDQLVRTPGAATSYLSFNLTKEPFTDRRVREAFAYGFDRETYCQVLRTGTCLPALS